jgi:hypothetical protein
MDFLVALGKIAPLYNLAIAFILLILFIKLFSTKNQSRVNLLPWKLIFFAVLIYTVEEIITILRFLDIINIPVHINGFFELLIIITFIYALLTLKENIRSKKI